MPTYWAFCIPPFLLQILVRKEAMPTVKPVFYGAPRGTSDAYSNVTSVAYKRLSNMLFQHCALHSHTGHYYSI